MKLLTLESERLYARYIFPADMSHMSKQGHGDTEHVCMTVRNAHIDEKMLLLLCAQEAEQFQAREH